MNMRNFRLSVIIPAFNEENNITETLSIIFDGCKKFSINFEVIVVDNNSTDNTVEAARKFDPKVNVIPAVNGTVGQLRNVGVSHSTGDLIAFIDADISLTDNWFIELKRLEKHIIETNIITGSKCLPEKNTFLSNGWFSLLTRGSTNYINSGNMVLSKKTFNIVGGFDPDLVTSEDYEFCQRALKKLTTLENNSNLKVLHRGYPDTVRQFILREAWHGIGDVSSLKSFINSKTALISAFSIFSVLALLITSIFNFDYELAIASLPIYFIIFYSFHAYKTKRPIKSFIYWPISLLYFLGRSYSIILRIRRTNNNLPKSPRLS